jgi:hypothetical protein
MQYNYSTGFNMVANLYQWNTFTGYEPTCYSFNLFKFNKVVSNTDPSPDSYNDNGDYIYKVPRTSIYKLNGNIPFYFEGKDFIGGINDTGGSGIAFKVVGIVEKSTNPNADDNTWTHVANTKLSVNSSTNTQYDAYFNNILFLNSPNLASLAGDLILDTPSVTLNAGDYIRFRFHFIDFTGTFNRKFINTGYIQQYFTFKLGNTSTRYQEQPYFSIKDSTTTEITYFDTKYYNSVNSFFQASSSNSIIFDKLTIEFFTSNSIFQPSEATQQYYSPIIDYFGIQPYDLLRIGSFNSPTVNYYEIASVSVIQRNSVSFSGGSFNVNPIFYGSNSPKVWYICPTPSSVASSYTASLFNTGDTVYISNTISNNVTASIKNVSTNGTDVILEFIPSTIVAEIPTSVTFSFPAGQRIATLTSNIPDTGSFNSGSSQNFAILRPKPNETSVIINYKKKPGDVSQTVLIPYDANDEIKNSVGNIYKTINPSIS